MSSLSRFQDAFGEALHGDTAAIEPWLGAPLADTPGLAVYRNTVARGSIDALVATFSTVVTMTGEDWFRAAAAVYVADHRPSTPSLLRYGADFPDWLAAFRPSQDTPYLPAIAHLDRLWWEAYFAADADPLDPAALSRLDAAGLETTAITLHPSVRMTAFDHNLPSLWLAHRDDGRPRDFDIAETAECLLLVRAEMQVTPVLVEPATQAFLIACQAGESVMTAAQRATAIDPAISLQDIIVANLAAGVFTDLAPARPGPQHDR